MNRATWTLQRHLHNISHLQLTLAALILSAFILYWVGLKPRAEAIQQAEGNIRTLISRQQQQQESQKQAMSPLVHQPHPPEVPSITELPNTLEILHRIALHNGIEILSPHFTLERDKDLYRYRLVAETESPYRNIRSFIRELPLALPASSLSSLQMQIVDEEAFILNTQFNIEFHFRPNPSSNMTIKGAAQR